MTKTTGKSYSIDDCNNDINADQCEGYNIAVGITVALGSFNYGYAQTHLRIHKSDGLVIRILTF